VKNKVAIVTGASSGIGRSAALMYAREGAAVIVSDVNKEGGQETVDLILKAGGKAVFEYADVANAKDCENLANSAIKHFGRLDYACNNAGIGGEQNLTADYSLEGWKQVIDINLNGVFYCMKYQIPLMLKSGGGSIVNMSSILGQVSFPGAPAYVAAKHALQGLTKNAAVEYGTQGIRVNAIGPAFIKTPLLNALDEATMDMLVQLHPIGRMGEPDEVAELVIWLSSDKASFVTGSYYAVDGGYLSR
jgi:NAD(P)-dependent dehydrogenase (short-subunit alcohol dehydrogenase family)